MISIVGDYYTLCITNDDVYHKDQICEAWQAVIEGFVDDNGLGL